ncbi:MAG: FtsX-like permease family protein [Bryobacteraceae bacterium]
MILRNSLRNRLRSILTILSFAASLCLMGLLAAMANALFLREATPEQALRLIVRNKVSLANPLQRSYQDRIRQAPGVKEVLIFQWFGGVYKDNRDPKNMFARFAVEPLRLFTVYPEYRIPEDQKKAFAQERTACIVGRKTAERHGMKIGDRITLAGDIFPVTLDLTVRGFYDSPRDNENLYFHYEYLNEGLREARDVVSVFVILGESAEAVAAIPQAVDSMFRNATLQTKTETERAFELSFLGFLGNVKVFMGVIFGAVTFAILLVSANTMGMSVRERIREVGILKTLGFTRGRILTMIMGESVAISLMGGVIGLGLASLICAALQQLPSTIMNMPDVAIPPVLGLACLAIAAAIGVVSSTGPAWSASRKPIVEALRFTD